MKSICLVFVVGCSSFDDGSAIEFAATLHDTTVADVAAPKECGGGGRYAFADNALTLTMCNGFTVLTVATVERARTATGSDRTIRLNGSMDYHLEGVSVGTEGTCDFAIAITSAFDTDGNSTQWAASGTVCDQDVYYGCREQPRFECF
jgi:hypothetical protein